MKEKFVVIMAGGRGERFWPQSRLARPKHLLPIVGETAMLRQTLDRIGDLVEPAHRYILTNSEQVAAVRALCPEIPADQIVSEPVGRDTAPAVGLATELIRRRNPDAVFAMLPADHVIHDQQGFRRVLQAAFKAAASEPVLVTIGVQPTSPATGYGYIRKGKPWMEFADLQAYRVEAFVEKPDAQTAGKYLESGRYLWNAGMFAWSVGAISKALQQHAPELAEGLAAIRAAWRPQTDINAALADGYATLPKISIDYAVMEKADNVVVLPSAFDWDDVGEWPAVARHHEADADGNVTLGDVLLQDSSNNIVYGGKDGHLLALLGVEDLIVVRSGDATLICPRSKAQDVKKLVQKLAQHPRYKTLC